MTKEEFYKAEESLKKAKKVLGKIETVERSILITKATPIKIAIEFDGVEMVFKNIGKATFLNVKGIGYLNSASSPELRDNLNDAIEEFMSKLKEALSSEKQSLDKKFENL